MKNKLGVVPETNHGMANREEDRRIEDMAREKTTLMNEKESLSESGSVVSNPQVVGSNPTYPTTTSDTPPSSPTEKVEA